MKQASLFRNRELIAAASFIPLSVYSILSFAAPAGAESCSPPEYCQSMTIGTASLLIAGLLFLLLINRIRYNKKLLKTINTDFVTGGMSFTKFRNEAARLLQDKNESYALVYADIQNFKYMNDTYGHEHGDVTLKAISEILAASAGEGELTARAYADHFVLLLKAGDDETLASRIRALWQKISDQISQEQDYSVLFKTGVCTFIPQEPGMNIDKIMDRALYALSSLGQLSENGMAFFNEEMISAIEKEKCLERDMNQALRHGEFIPYYQPKVDLSDRKIIGAEALARWNHPEHGLIAPGEFIPFFEKNNFVIKLDLCIFETVCRQQRELIKRGVTPCPVSVNFSRRHLRHPEWCEKLTEIIRRYSLPASLFELELTETIAEDDLALVRTTTGKLKSNGFRISIDDFGAGYSSVQLLYRIPIDVLKLDRSCLSSTQAQLMKHEILSSLIHIAKENRIQVIWEGVENKHQEDFIKEHGCTCAQGFYYARPMPFEDYAQALSGGVIPETAVSVE